MWFTEKMFTGGLKSVALYQGFDLHIYTILTFVFFLIGMYFF